MTTENLIEHASNIRAAISLLNKAIIQAAKEGVQIENLQEIDATGFEDKCRAVIYNPIIIRKEIL